LLTCLGYEDEPVEARVLNNQGPAGPTKSVDLSVALS
jgi:hypothetical protein